MHELYEFLKDKETCRRNAVQHILTQFHKLLYCCTEYHLNKVFFVEGAWLELMDRLLSWSVFELFQNNLFSFQFAKHALESAFAARI